MGWNYYVHDRATVNGHSRIGDSTIDGMKAELVNERESLVVGWQIVVHLVYQYRQPVFVTVAEQESQD